MGDMEEKLDSGQTDRSAGVFWIETGAHFSGAVHLSNFVESA
jgi:hypothetical protein